jgi:hypothetical protein
VKCPLCKERIKRNAIKCRFCGTIVDKKTEEIQFIKNGFDKIEAECKTLEKLIFKRSGFIVRWHRFSEDELLSYIAKIENFARKIKADIENWKESKKPEESVQRFYNENARRLHDRLAQLQDLIQLRHPTLWERLGTIFRAFYFHLVEKLLPLIGCGIKLGYKRQNKIPGSI